MPSPTKNSPPGAFFVAIIFLPAVICLAETAPAPTEVVVPPLMVSAASSAAQATPSAFLATFISTAVRLSGPKFISWITTAVKLRPDLAPKIVVAALNIARLNTPSFGGRISATTISQIIAAAVAAAPESASAIVRAAIQSEPYASASIVSAAVATAPDQASNVQTAVSTTTAMSILPSVASLNPAEQMPSNVNSPEQPPSGP